MINKLLVWGIRDLSSWFFDFFFYKPDCPVLKLWHFFRSHLSNSFEDSFSNCLNCFSTTLVVVSLLLLALLISYWGAKDFWHIWKRGKTILWILLICLEYFSLPLKRELKDSAEEIKKIVKFCRELRNFLRVHFTFGLGNSPLCKLAM